MNPTIPITSPHSSACDVLVIGAGPTGLMAANLLARRGVHVRIVDKSPHPANESRAAVMSARSLELFTSLGLQTPLLERGLIQTDANFQVSGKDVGSFHFEEAHAPDTPYPFLLTIPQSETEQVLLSALAEVNLPVERDLNVTSVRQSRDGVEIEAQNASGALVPISARYVIGADGAHSLVRRTLNLSFAGAQYPQTFLLGDVEINWDLGPDQFRIFMHGERIGLFIPLGRAPGGTSSRYARVMSTDLRPASQDDGDHWSPLALADLEKSFAETCCRPLTLSYPRWLTTFRTHHRAVNRFRVGSLFLAGDAAHIHSPAGGQGMNTGLQDAANLAWKLASVLRSGAPDNLLDTYEQERLPVARQVLEFTDKLFTTAAGQRGWRASLRDLVAPAVIGSVSNLSFVEAKAFRRLAQLDISYAPNEYVGNSTGEATATKNIPDSAQAGKRAPNAQLSRHRDLFDLLTGYRFHLLALLHKKTTTTEISARLAALPELDAGQCQIHWLVFGAAAGTTDSREEPLERGEIFTRYGVPENQEAFILVRPDGYIAWRSEALDIPACQERLRTLRLFSSPTN